MFTYYLLTPILDFSLLNLFNIPPRVKLKSSVIFHSNPKHDGLSKLSLAVFSVCSIPRFSSGPSAD